MIKNLVAIWCVLAPVLGLFANAAQLPFVPKSIPLAERVTDVGLVVAGSVVRTYV